MEAIVGSGSAAAGWGLAEAAGWDLAARVAVAATGVGLEMEAVRMRVVCCSPLHSSRWCKCTSTGLGWEEGAVEMEDSGALGVVRSHRTPG